jgi:moderate conductance mechanosensitive channel
MAARLAIGIATVLVLLQVWGLPALPWLFSTELGRQILGGLGTIGVTIGCAVVVWELTNLTIKRHLSRLQAQAKAARAARLRTFLPMLRMILMVGILIMVGLTVLSQIGVNIAPLLAGAGVVGIAIGLGSQKLVQDVITGLFLLLENVMQVGDVVSLGGMTGVVEELSIRSIRLRADDGSIHVIPFSAVTTVTNMTRDFGQAVIEARIAITEDYDRVVALLRETFEEMRTEPLWATDITGDLDMQGLARLDDTAMVLKCRIRCGPFARWRVLREYQRRMQQKFAAAGIMLPMAPPVAPPVVPPVASPVVPRV